MQEFTVNVLRVHVKNKFLKCLGDLNDLQMFVGSAVNYSVSNSHLSREPLRGNRHSIINY